MVEKISEKSLRALRNRKRQPSKNKLYEISKLYKAQDRILRVEYVITKELSCI